jgi:hypothetical protein
VALHDIHAGTANVDARHLPDQMAAMSRQTAFSFGCYFEDESRRHRSLLRELLRERGALVADTSR